MIWFSESMIFPLDTYFKTNSHKKSWTVSSLYALLTHLIDACVKTNMYIILFCSLNEVHNFRVLSPSFAVENSYFHNKCSAIEQVPYDSKFVVFFYLFFLVTHFNFDTNHLGSIFLLYIEQPFSKLFKTKFYCKLLWFTVQNQSNKTKVSRGYLHV